MKLPSFTYRVDSRGHIFRLDGTPHEAAPPKKSAQVFVDGVQRPQGWLTNFDQPERDLLSSARHEGREARVALAARV
jgi:hypothetical protein